MVRRNFQAWKLRQLARLYTSKRGRSGSTRPVSKRPPAWCKYAPEEVQALVLKLAREGNTPGTIGVLLRDRYGIPLVKHITGKTITKILSEAGQPLRMPLDLEELLVKANALRKHLDRHKKDYPNKRSLANVESKIHRLVKYYKSLGRLQTDWKYTPMAASVA